MSKLFISKSRKSLSENSIEQRMKNLTKVKFKKKIKNNQRNSNSYLEKQQQKTPHYKQSKIGWGKIFTTYIKGKRLVSLFHFMKHISIGSYIL